MEVENLYCQFFSYSPNRFWRILSMLFNSHPIIKWRWKKFCCNYFDAKPQFDWTIKTVCIVAYSSTRVQSNRRSGSRLRLARVRFLSYAKPILRKKKTTVLQSNVDVGSVISAAVSRVLKLERGPPAVSPTSSLAHQLPPPPARRRKKKKSSVLMGLILQFIISLWSLNTKTSFLLGWINCLKTLHPHPLS